MSKRVCTDGRDCVSSGCAAGACIRVVAADPLGQMSLQAQMEKTIRRQALEEAKRALPDIEDVSPMPDGDAAQLFWIAREGRKDGIEACHAAIDVLLAADPREAMDETMDASPANMDGAKTYHDGVRDALALVPDVSGAKQVNDHSRGFDAAILEIRDRISALLPQPKDEAEEIVDRYCADLGIVPTPDARAVSVAMLRRHLSQGWRAPE